MCRKYLTCQQWACLHKSCSNNPKSFLERSPEGPTYSSHKTSTRILVEVGENFKHSYCVRFSARTFTFCYSLSCRHYHQDRFDTDDAWEDLLDSCDYGQISVSCKGLRQSCIAVLHIFSLSGQAWHVVLQYRWRRSGICGLVCTRMCLILILSHGSAAVESGLSVNANVLVDNLHDECPLAQCIVCGAVQYTHSKWMC